jgi:hypothetical protein
MQYFVSVGTWKEPAPTLQALWPPDGADGVDAEKIQKKCHKCQDFETFFSWCGPAPALIKLVSSDFDKHRSQAQQGQRTCTTHGSRYIATSHFGID